MIYRNKIIKKNILIIIMLLMFLSVFGGGCGSNSRAPDYIRLEGRMYCALAKIDDVGSGTGPHVVDQWVNSSNPNHMDYVAYGEGANKAAYLPPGSTLDRLYLGHYWSFYEGSGYVALSESLCDNSTTGGQGNMGNCYIPLLEKDFDNNIEEKGSLLAPA